MAELGAIATEAENFQCQLNILKAKKALEETIVCLLLQLLYEGDPTTLEKDVARLELAIVLGEKLNLDLALDRAQEIYFDCLHQRIVPDCLVAHDSPTSCPWNITQIKPLLKLGKTLAIDVSCWLN